MKLIVGLGNPGKEYEHSRHNAGFMVVDELHKRLDASAWKQDKKFKAYVSEAIINGEKVILAKPVTFMNLSGEAIAPLATFYKIAPEDILVVFDELDIPFGQIRLRKSGGPGTHNGMKSTVEKLGSKEFTRLRFGIESRGETAPKQQDTTSFVLSPFTKEEQPILNQTIKEASLSIETFLKEGIESAMNKHNNASKD
jgi:PTH1 family peptidyl-tRNA hydrolase